MSRFSEYVSSLTYEDLSSEIIQKAKTCLIDTLGALLGSQSLPAVRLMNAYAMMLNGSPSATLIGERQKTSVQGAALGNGAAAAALDVDDCHILAQGHPGAVVIPAALAAGESVGSSGKALLASIVVGYEVAVRSGAFQASQPGESLVWGSGRWACPGAAAACANLFGLSAERTAHAIGIADTFAPRASLLDTVEVKPLPMTKESIGWGSMVGLSASLLARQGYTGPTVEYDAVEEKIRPLGEEFVILGVTYKPYPSCRWTHSAIDAVLALKEEHPGCITPETVKDITVRVFKKAMHINHPAPESVETAQYSIPFTVATAIADGEVWLDQMSDRRLRDPRLEGIAGRVRMVHDPEFDAAFPARPEEVEIRTRKGDAYRKRVDFPKGDLENPLSAEQLKSKFMRLSAVSLEERTAFDLLDAVERIETLPDVRRLIEIIHE